MIIFKDFLLYNCNIVFTYVKWVIIIMVIYISKKCFDTITYHYLLNNMGQIKKNKTKLYKIRDRESFIARHREK